MVIIKVYISTGIPTRVVGTCFCGENLGSAGNLSICFNFKVFSFVMTCNNKKYGAISGCHITFCAITFNSPNSQYLEIFGFNLIYFMCFVDKRNASETEEVGIIQYSTKVNGHFLHLEIN